MEKCVRANGVLFLCFFIAKKFPLFIFISVEIFHYYFFFAWLFPVYEIKSTFIAQKKIQLLRIEQLLNDSERDYSSSVRVHCIVSWHSFFFLHFPLNVHCDWNICGEKSFFHSIFTREWEWNISATKYTKHL